MWTDANIKTLFVNHRYTIPCTVHVKNRSPSTWNHNYCWVCRIHRHSSPWSRGHFLGMTLNTNKSPTVYHRDSGSGTLHHVSVDSTWLTYQVSEHSGTPRTIVPWTRGQWHYTRLEHSVPDTWDFSCNTFVVPSTSHFLTDKVRFRVSDVPHKYFPMDIYVRCGHRTFPF